MITFNINDMVRVKLTDHGRRILEGKAHPKEDSEGWSEWQLWMLFRDFGGHVYWGCKMPFETKIQLLGGSSLPLSISFNDFVEAIYEAGWRSTCDAQHTEIEKLWRRLWPQN